jgi:hypothetical protein
MPHKIFVNKQGWNLLGDGKPIRTGSTTDFKGKPEFGRKIKMSKKKEEKCRKEKCRMQLRPKIKCRKIKVSKDKNVER